MSDQQDIWASIREKLSLEERVHLDNALDIATDQFSEAIEAHERKQTEREEAQRLMRFGTAGIPTPSMYDPDGELERAEVQIISGSNDADFYTNDSVKQFIEKRLLIAWTALKNADHLNDLAAPNLTTNQTGNDAAMDIIGKCIEEIEGLNIATVNGKAIIV